MACPEGSELIPTEMCACAPTDEIKAKIYPEWATYEDMKAADAAGQENYKNPNGFWPVCDASLSCEEGFYLNELACKCFSLAQCLSPCPKFNMPTSPCGCTDDYSEYLALFPHWATEDNISKSISDGMQKASEQGNNSMLVRPENWPKCEQREECPFFNELACKCFSEIHCMLWCGEGMTLDPTKGCSCITEKEARAIYPDWATQADIDFSFKLHYSQIIPIEPPFPIEPPHPIDPICDLPVNPIEKPFNWPECDGEIPVCDDN